MTIQDASKFLGLDYDATTAGTGSTGDGLGIGKESTTLCVCDYGYFGPDCSLGETFDPLTPSSDLPEG
jgi:hypothetical protein